MEVEKKGNPSKRHSPNDDIVTKLMIKQAQKVKTNLHGKLQEEKATNQKLTSALEDRKETIIQLS